MTPMNTRRTRQSHAAYEQYRRKQVAYGRWQPYMDAEPVRAHVRALMAAGVSRRRIAVLAGVHEATIGRLLYGRTDRAPSGQVRTASARALLSVRATKEALSPRTAIDATGTKRRLQALVALGWSRQKLAESFGADRSCIGRYMVRDRVQASTALAVKDLYDRMWDTAPPEETRWDRAAAAAARNYAADRGWVKPMAWDDETIDDPAAKPSGTKQGKAPAIVDPIAVEQALKGEKVHLNSVEAAEVVRIATDRGMSARQIAAITGRTARTVVRRRAAA